MTDRVVPSSEIEIPTQDLLEKFKNEYPVIYNSVEVMIPESFAEGPEIALFILSTAITFVKAFGDVATPKIAKFS